MRTNENTKIKNATLYFKKKKKKKKRTFLKFSKKFLLAKMLDF